MQVDIVGFDLEGIPSRLGDELGGTARTCVAERSAQLRHVHVQGMRCRLGRSIGPERVDERFGGDDLVRVQEEEREQSPLFGAPQGDRTIGALYLEGPEHAELHGGFRQ